MERLFNFLGYIWKISTCLIELALVLLVFSRLQDKQTIIIVSILGLIYTTVRTMAYGEWQSLVGMATALDNHFARLWSILGVQDDSDYKEASQKIAKSFERQARKMYIEMTTLAIISLICIFHLLMAL